MHIKDAQSAGHASELTIDKRITKTMNYKETDPFITKYYDKFIDIMRKENHPLLHEMMTKMKTDDVKEVVMWLFENSDEVLPKYRKKILISLELKKHLSDLYSNLR